MTVALANGGVFPTAPGPSTTLVVDNATTEPCAFELTLNIAGIGSNSVIVRIFVSVLVGGSAVCFVEETIVSPPGPTAVLDGWRSGPIATADGYVAAEIEQASGSSFNIGWALFRLA